MNALVEAAVGAVGKAAGGGRIGAGGGGAAPPAVSHGLGGEAIRRTRKGQLDSKGVNSTADAVQCSDDRSE